MDKMVNPPKTHKGSSGEGTSIVHHRTPTGTLWVAASLALGACRPPAYVMPLPELDSAGTETERAAQYEHNKVERSGNAFTGVHYSTSANPVPFHLKVNYDEFFDHYEETQTLFDRAVAASYASLFFIVPTGVFIGIGLGDTVLEASKSPDFLNRNEEIAIWSLAGASLITFVVMSLVSRRALYRLPERYNSNLRRELRLAPEPRAATQPKRRISFAPVGIQICW